MSKRLFDYDPFTGVTQWFEATDKGFNLHSEADVAPILDENARKRSAGRAYYAKDKDMWKVGSVPNIVMLQWATELGIPPDRVYSDEFAGIIAKKLACSDFAKLKTADVRI